MLPHRLIPVLIDCCGASGVGRIFRLRGMTVRLSQFNEPGEYDVGLKFTETVELSLDTYRGDFLDTAYANFKPGLVGIYHAEQFDGGYLIDFYRKYRF